MSAGHNAPTLSEPTPVQARASTLQRVPVVPRDLQDYGLLVASELITEVRDLAAELRGVRVVQVSSTAMGGGVAELLQSLVPLELGLGIDVEWRLLCPDDRLFDVTKHLHNALQGRRQPLAPEEFAIYEARSAHCGPMLGQGFDIALVHDPQPAALRLAAPEAADRWLWRCHIDTQDPEPSAWAYLRGIVEGFDRAIFTLAEFVPVGFPVPVDIVAPAIDPLSTKNTEMTNGVARNVVMKFGIDPRRPLVAQIARFDPWKDPLGVMAAFERVRVRVPEAQLALVGSLATDDPEGWEVLHEVVARAATARGVRVLSNLDGVGAHEVNAFQRAADVAVQKSLREGFGLTVSEALWKKTPVVGGRAGGIPMQLGEQSPLLVDSVEQCAERVVELLDDPVYRTIMGNAGHERVRRDFLIVRLLRDELRTFVDMVHGPTAASPTV
jgi:trehalose synthase